MVFFEAVVAAVTAAGTESRTAPSSRAMPSPEYAPPFERLLDYVRLHYPQAQLANCQSCGILLLRTTPSTTKESPHCAKCRIGRAY